MAKKQKYELDLLLKAVLLYADQYGGKIKATQLAKWASENVPGLEGVKDYHFIRPYKNSSGKMIEKDCTRKIHDINAKRNLNTMIERNILISSSNINDFFQLDQTAQRQQIINAREQIDRLKSKYLSVEQENKILVAENLRLKKEQEDLLLFRREHEKKTDRIESKLKQYGKILSEAQMKELLETIGIEDDRFSLLKHTHSLEIREEFTFDNVIDGIDF